MKKSVVAKAIVGVGSVVAAFAISASAASASQVENPANVKSSGIMFPHGDKDGNTVTILIRSPESKEAENAKIVKHAALQGGSVVLVGIVFEDQSRIVWGSKSKSQEYWNDLERRFVAEIDRIVAAQSPKETPNHKTGSHEKAVSISHPLPGLIQARFSSDAVKKSATVSSIIFNIVPNDATGGIAVVASGATMMDTLGGKKGVTVIGVMPVGPAIVIPNDPKQFAVNVVTLPVNPVLEAQTLQAPFTELLAPLPVGNAVKDPAGTLGKLAANISPTVSNPPERLERWIDDPGRAASNTGKDIAKGASAVGNAVSDVVNTINPFKW